MYTLLLVLTNDDILKSRTGTKKEHRVGIACRSQLANFKQSTQTLLTALSIRTSTRATVKPGPATVVDSTSGDCDNLRVSLGGSRRGNATLVSQAGHGGGDKAHSHHTKVFSGNHVDSGSKVFQEVVVIRFKAQCRELNVC